MDRFLQDQNIVLYRRLRNSSTGEVERRMIITLLRGEMAKLKIGKDEPQQFKLGKSVRRQKQTPSGLHHAGHVLGIPKIKNPTDDSE